MDGQMYALISVYIMAVRVIFAIDDSVSKVICPSMCKCDKRKAECKSRTHDLDFIPTLPSGIQSLKFQGNILSVIEKKTFHNLTLLRLTSLSLVDNNVGNITLDAFSELVYLEKLIISKEPLLAIPQVEQMLYSLTRNIKAVNFLHMPWDTVPSLSGLKTSSVTEISLANNHLHHLNGSAFQNLGIKTLDLSFNGIIIEHFNMSGLENVRNLNLAGNWFKQFPNFCPNYMPNLQRLHFQYNKITEINEYNFKCLQRLKYLNLNSLAIRLIYSNTFSELKSLETLSLRRMAGQLRQIKPLAFKNKSLKKLYLAQNSFKFDHYNFNYSTIFRSSPNLVELDLSQNTFVNDELINKMMSGLTKLRILHLGSCDLTYFPASLVPSLNELNELHLSDNKIQGWDGNLAFGNSSSLEVLDLSGNQITMINKTSFPMEILKSIKKLNLSRNSFSCVCTDVKWFYNWMLTNGKKLAETEGIICKAPKRLSSLSLRSLTVHDICPLSKAVIHAIIAVSSFSLIVITTLLLLYKSRWRIRHWMYKRTLKRRDYEKLLGDIDFEYDAYLVFADDDRDFVLQTLSHMLETRYGYKLCIRYRDFEAGEFKSNNCVENINKSRKILVVLSNNFAKCKWCEFELGFSLNRCIEEKKDILLLVLLEEISYRHLSNVLKTLITMKSYIVWSEENMGETLFWEKMVTGLHREYTNHVEDAQDQINTIQ